jgi:RHS repeat-associated protein
MFGRIARQCTYMLLILSLLLTSLLPPARPVHAWFPEEDPDTYGAQDPGQGDDAAPSSGEGYAGPRQGMGDEDCYTGCSLWWWLLCLILGDPVSTSAGAYYFDLPLLDLGGPTDLNFTLWYRSDFNQAVGWGAVIGVPQKFWWSPLENLEYSHGPPLAFVTAQVGNGDFISFKREGGQWVPTDRDDFGYEDNVYPARWLLQEVGDYFYLMDPVEEQVHIFYKADENFARIARIVDRNGNQLIYSYTGATDLHPARVEDGLGRSLDFTYQAVGGETALTTVTDQAGRQVIFTHEAQGADNGSLWTLRSVTDPMSQTTVFHYTTVPTNGWFWGNLITELERPAGNAPYTQTYEKQTLNGNDNPRVVSQRDAYGNTLTVSYDPVAYRVTESRPDGATVVYEHYSHHGLPKSVTDPAGKTIHFGRDEAANRMTSITDRLGDTITLGYHAETGKIASRTDAEGHTTTRTYTAQAQTFTSVSASLRLVSKATSGQTLWLRPLPRPGWRFWQEFWTGLAHTASATFTFYNLTRITYADGTYEDFAYDDRGNVITHTDRISNTWTYTYNGRGQVLTATNPEGGVETYTYNADDATLHSRTDSDTGVTTYQYDAYKRVSQIDYPDGTSEQFTYDDNDLVTQTTDQRDVAYTYEYDANDNLTEILRASGTPVSQTHQYQYDAMDRLGRFIDPAGNETQYAYTYWDGLDRITYPDDAQLSLTYDLRHWISGIVDEAGQSWQIGRDDESVYSSVTTPEGRHIGLATDKLGYITQVTDPLSNTFTIERDALERITKVTDRLGREVTIDRDGEGRVISITMPVVGTTTYTRNGLGLITRITDQRGNPWDFGYTVMGRLNLIQDPLGNEWYYTYDAMGRLFQIAYPDGVTETRAYDGNGNLTARQFSDGLTLTYAYDELNRPTVSSSVPITVTYDDRDNITNTQMEGADFGATYDDRNRLKTATYPSTGLRAGDGQMTVAYTYDDRGLVTQVTDDLTGSWVKFTYDDDRLLTRVERSNDVTTDIERDANGRITRIRHGDKGEMRFTLDAEDRITQIVENLPLDVVSFLASELRQYTYDEADQITSAGFSYDARGRRTADPERTYTWDSADRLTGITHGSTDVTYEYTAQGEVARRSVNGVTTEYFYNYAVRDHPILAEKKDGGYVRFYVYTPGGLLLYCVDVPGAEAYFYHFNHIGTTLFLTDGDGEVTDTYGYTPYGRMVKHLGSSDQPFTYVGERGVRQEGETGLYHMRARYYDSLTSRFISRDPIWAGLVEDPREVNPYQYATQNPLSYIDPSGLQVWVGTAGNTYDNPFSLPDGTVVGAVDDTSGEVTWGLKSGQATFKPVAPSIADKGQPPQTEPQPKRASSQRGAPTKWEECEDDEDEEDGEGDGDGNGDGDGGCDGCSCCGCSCSLVALDSPSRALRHVTRLLSPWLFFVLLTVCVWAALRWGGARKREEDR